MDDRTNTIAMMVLAAGIVALGGSIATGEYFHAERPETMGYVVEGVEAEADEGGEAAKPIEFYLASADPAKGADVFKKCAACHTDAKGGPNGLGPNLWATVGKPHGHVAGFAYTDALKSKPGSWDWKALDAWLISPKKYAPGTKMTFAGLSKPEDRANLIAYLNKQSDAPLPMPAAPAEATAPAPASGEKVAGTVPAQTEAQAARQPEDNIAGEAAPATSGREAQEKTH